MKLCLFLYSYNIPELIHWMISLWDCDRSTFVTNFAYVPSSLSLCSSLAVLSLITLCFSCIRISCQSWYIWLFLCEGWGDLVRVRLGWLASGAREEETVHHLLAEEQCRVARWVVEVKKVGWEGCNGWERVCVCLCVCVVGGKGVNGVFMCVFVFMYVFMVVQSLSLSLSLSLFLSLKDILQMVCFLALFCKLNIVKWNQGLASIYFVVS